MTAQETTNHLGPIVMGTVNELTRIGEHHSCIFAGAVLTRVLHRKGFPKAYPMTVRAFILNPRLYEWVKINGFDFNGREKEWIALGGMGISLSAGRKEDTPDLKWLGHLAVILPNFFDDRHAMLDLTVTQADQPQWGVILRPTVVRVPDSFVKGEAEFKAAANGSLVIYKGFPDDHRYTETNLWKEQSRYDGIADRIVTAR